MPRFQLLVRELGKEPRVVPLADPIVIGRSRTVDLTVDDEEVGRKQFRIGVTSGFVVLEGLGATNPTRVDDSVLASGEKTVVPAGATIRVGKTSFVVESADKTETLPPGPADAMPESTMVSPGPGAGPGPAAPMPDGTMLQPEPGPARPGATPVGGPGAVPPPGSEGTGGDKGPLNTMEFHRPGAPAQGGVPPAVQDETSAGGPPTPAQQPGQQDHGQANYGETMAKGFRPGSFRPGASDPVPAAQPPAAKPPAAKPQPPIGQPPAPQPSKAQPPFAQSPPPTTALQQPLAEVRPTPPAAPPTAALPPPQMPPPAAAGPARPKTVAVRPEDMAPLPAPAAPGDDLESRLHQSMPRLFVKGGGLKRRLRLMKANNKVGRAETADVLLPHESVSELHAEIRFDGSQWTLRDNGSTNGSVVDGQHLRGSEKPIGRNTLIAIGSLNIIFLCVEPGRAAQNRRDEDRALHHLVRGGRISKDEAAQIQRLTRDDASQSIAEVLLMETALGPIDWANAIATARAKVGLLARILRLFSFSRR